jgi:chromosome partitioning protein
MGSGAVAEQQTVLSVINLKGGTSKTTTAVFIAHAFHELGRSVLLVDADPQASAMNWNDSAPEPFPFPVMQLATTNLHKQLRDITGNRFDVVVIDTPPLEQKSGIVVSSLRVASLAVCPVAPTPIEYQRLDGVRQAVEESGSLRVEGEPVPLAVLLTRTVPQASSTSVWREQIAADGLRVLQAAVGRREQFAQAYGDNIERAMATAYGDAVNELLTEGVA